MGILISENIDFKSKKCYKRQGHCALIKIIIQQEDITIIYTPLKEHNTWNETTEMKREIIYSNSWRHQYTIQ